MVRVHMMVGIPGSGKSTYARQLSQEKGYKIVSTDVIRMLHPDWAEPLIWPEVYRLTAEHLKSGTDVIFDATNITPKVRNRFKDEVSKHFNEFEVAAYYFDTLPAVCAKRVEMRNKMANELYLPVEVVFSYGEKIVKPTPDEGFIEIINVNDLERKEYE